MGKNLNHLLFCAFNADWRSQSFYFGIFWGHREGGLCFFVSGEVWFSLVLSVCLFCSPQAFLSARTPSSAIGSCSRWWSLEAKRWAGQRIFYLFLLFTICKSLECDLRFSKYYLFMEKQDGNKKCFPSIFCQSISVHSPSVASCIHILVHPFILSICLPVHPSFDPSIYSSSIYPLIHLTICSPSEGG